MQNRTIELSLDGDDYKTIRGEIDARITRGDLKILPDGSSNHDGAILAEVVRDLDEYRSLYEVEHPGERAPQWGGNRP